MDPDSLLAENARITANATCGIGRREYYCRIVDHAAFYTGLSRVKRQVYTYTQAARTYKAVDGSVIECNYCDDRDPKLRHPIDYVVQGDSDRWWQSPTLAEGLKYHAVTIDIDLNQVYQIVFVILRMGDSPRPANWILEKSIDGITFEPWVFFAETAETCRRLYQPLISYNMKITSAPRPNSLRNDEVYCTTYFSQPQNLEAGEIIVTLTMDREGASQSHYEMTSPIDPELIDFLSARFVRLKFQKLQTLSGDWMTLPNQMDQSVYNRYYYSIRNIKVGGKCICNSHANRCESKVINPNVDQDSLCKKCLPGHFNLDIENRDGCQACFCMGLTTDCQGVSVSTARTLEQEGKLGTGHGIRLAYSAQPSYRDVHRVLRVRLHESSFRVLVEATEGDLNRFPISHTQTQEAPQLAYRDPTQLARPQRINFSTAGRQATIVDIMTVLSNLTRIYVKAKYTDDQSYAE
nr:unnamed protein product [Spirometra erinaceieuropaei]